MMRVIDWHRVGELFTYDSSQPLIFSSLAFLVLFTLFYALYIPIKRHVALRNIYTLAFSIYFYYLSSGFYFVLLLISSIVDFVLAHFIYNSKDKVRKKLFLWASISVNLGILAYFKYTNFFISSINDIFQSNFVLKDIFLPVGISFFTFQTLSYSIDVYRGKLEPLTNQVKDVRSAIRRFFDFAFFVSFFPQLVAGPIVRAADFLPQLKVNTILTKVNRSRAFYLIIGGLFKKAVISDYISVNFVDRVFESPALYSGLENLLAVYGYAIQIYCDFSGYSDMAIGLGLLLGFTLPENFRKPYQADSVRDFWRRWHISLSTWLRDYLYISLGGSKKGEVRTYWNLMVTMLLGGLWHGASWVFVIWGGLHGTGLAIDRWMEVNFRQKVEPYIRGFVLWVVILLIAVASTMLSETKESIIPLVTITFAVLVLTLLAVFIKMIRKPLAVIWTFHFVVLGWVYFRAGSLGMPLPPMEVVRNVLGQILNDFKPELWPQLWSAYKNVLLLIALGFGLHFVPMRLELRVMKSFGKLPSLVHALILAAVIWLVAQTAGSGVRPFIYFQF